MEVERTQTHSMHSRKNTATTFKERKMQQVGETRRSGIKEEAILLVIDCGIR